MNEAQWQYACGVCGNPAEFGHLCFFCDASVVRALRIFPSIIADLQSMMTRVRATPTDRVRVDSSWEQELPPLEYGERAHVLYASVADWAVSWAGVVDSAGPAHLRGFDPRGRVQRMPSKMLAFTAASQVANWLVLQHDTIKQHADAPQYALDVTSVIGDEGRMLGYRPRQQRVQGKRCRACDSSTLRLVWPLDGEPRLRCSACGGVWECGPQLIMMTLRGE